MAPPKFERTEREAGIVSGLALAGYRDSDIADVIGCTESTLKKYYAEDLMKSRVLANAKVIQGLYQNAVSGNVTAQIFWAKTRLGWRETVEESHLSEERRLQRLSYAELAQLAAPVLQQLVVNQHINVTQLLEGGET